MPEGKVAWAGQLPTPNFQLPTPKPGASKQLGGFAREELARSPFTSTRHSSSSIPFSQIWSGSTAFSSGCSSAVRASSRLDTALVAGDTLVDQLPDLVTRHLNFNPSIIRVSLHRRRCHVLRGRSRSRICVLAARPSMAITARPRRTLGPIARIRQVMDRPEFCERRHGRC